MDNLINKCQNCEQEYQPDQKFCVHCGQETKLSKLNVKELFVNLFHTVFNYDNTLFSTIKIIFKPWKYTELYIAGKRKSYMNPIRIFLVLMLVYVGMLLSNLHINNIPAKALFELESKLLESFDQTTSSFDLDPQDCEQLDSLKQTVFTNVYLLNDTTYKKRTEANLFGHSISQYDIIHLTPEEIFKKHNITGFLNQRILTQYIKIKDQQEGGLKFLVSNVVWGMCGAIFLLAAFFKLLYIRSRRFYIEHIVLILNVHVVTIFIAIVVAIVVKITASEEDAFVTNSLFSILISFPVFIFLSLYYYYKQSIWKTLVKFFLIMFNYVSFGLITIVVISVVSLFFY